MLWGFHGLCKRELDRLTFRSEGRLIVGISYGIES